MFDWISDLALLSQHSEVSNTPYAFIAFLLLTMACSLVTGTANRPIFMGVPLALTALAVVAMMAAGLHIIGIERWIDRILVSTLGEISIMTVVWACVAAVASIGVFVTAIIQRSVSIIILSVSVLFTAASTVFQAFALRVHTAAQDILFHLQDWSGALALATLGVLVIRAVHQMLKTSQQA